VRSEALIEGCAGPAVQARGSPLTQQVFRPKAVSVLPGFLEEIGPNRRDSELPCYLFDVDAERLLDFRRHLRA